MIARRRISSFSRRLMLTITLVILGAALVSFFGVRAYRAYTHFYLDAPATSLRDV